MLTSLALGGAAVAIVAMVIAASLRQKLKVLSQSHWELRYEFARLRARVAKLDGGTAAPDPEDPAAAGH